MTIVLVEGESDRAAVEVLAARLGVTGVEVVSGGEVTGGPLGGVPVAVPLLLTAPAASSAVVMV